MIYIQLDWEEAILEWEETDKLEDQVQWRRGDIALALKPVYGEATLERFTEEVGVEYNTLRQYRQVSEAYQIDDRSSSLSWTHHMRVANRPDRLEWLQRASEARPKWSVSRMLEKIAAEDARKEQKALEARQMTELEERAAHIAREVEVGNLTVAEGIAKAIAEENSRRQQEEDRQGQLRRARERLKTLLIGWIELATLPDHPDRTAILEGMTSSDRQKIEMIESIYVRYRNGDIASV